MGRMKEIAAYVIQCLNNYSLSKEDTANQLVRIYGVDATWANTQVEAISKELKNKIH